MTVLKGADAVEYLERQAATQQSYLEQILRPLDPASALSTWLETLRCIEELINLPGEMEDKAAEARIFTLDLAYALNNPLAFLIVRDAVAPQFGAAFAQRLFQTALRTAAMWHAFHIHGVFQASEGLRTLAHAVGYFQSRRRALVSLAYSLPGICRGTQRVAPLDGLNVLLVPTELQGLSLTALHRDMMLARFFPDFELIDDGDRLVSSHEFKPLDGRFLEPERASIMDMFEAGATTAATRSEGLERTDPQKLFSAAELRNDIRYLRTAYAEFDLDKTAFGPMATMVTKLSTLAKDDYHIKVKPYRFEKFATATGIDAAGRAALVHSGADYVANSNVFAPLIALNGSYFTTVTLLSRFIYDWKTKCLNRIHRFRVRSGFIFEHIVKAALLRQGFEVTGIKRINRKEFDVVAVKDGVIFNLQCKNNLVDLTQVEGATDTFVRYNRGLNRYYDKALKKEEMREDLLKAELGLTEIRHMVISRFTIATTNPRVLPFARIGELEAAVQSAYGESTSSISI